MSHTSPGGSPRWVRLLCVLSPLAAAGCGVVPRSRLTSFEEQNRTLTEQTRAQLAEIENLRVHSRKLQDQLAQAEEELAVLTDRRTGARGVPLPASLRNRLVELSERHAGLEFDPHTGVSKFDSDVLFDSGAAQLRPESRQLLDDFANVFRAPEAQPFRIMVVGHSDDRAIARRETRDQFPNNWHLSTSRALAVLDYLRAAGLPEDHLGVAGFGDQQPLLVNRTADARQRNRRVEIFVLGPETPVVGWTETTSSLY